MKKLTNEQVTAMRREYATNDVAQRELAEKYGLHPNSVGKIVKGQRWPDAGGPVVGGVESSEHDNAHYAVCHVVETSITRYIPVRVKSTLERAERICRRERGGNGPPVVVLRVDGEEPQVGEAIKGLSEGMKVVA